MPVNKFGSYLDYKTEPNKLKMAVTKQPVSEKNLLYKSTVSLKGTSRPDTLRYVLETGLMYYEFKITGKIEHIEVSTNLVLVSLNTENVVPPTDLIGMTIQKGDTLTIYQNRAIGDSKNVFIQFIILCPLIRDEHY